MEPYSRHSRPEIEELLRTFNRLIDEEGIEIAYIILPARQQTVHPYEELDDLSASLAFAKLPSLD